MGRYFVQEDGAVNYEEVVGGRHVAQGLGVDEVVECGEEGLCGVDRFVDESSVGGGGVY